MMTRGCIDIRDTPLNVRADSMKNINPTLLLVLLAVALLAPFAGKAFHIDDPLFIWTAKHISVHPGDPYGLRVNWYGFPQAMHEVMWNPPLSSYYMALAGSIMGWSEPALHLAFLLPAVLAVLGIHSLAGRFTDRPLVAAIIAVLSPAFLVCATTVMCDILMLAFLVWAAALWVKGIEAENKGALWGSAFAMAACVLTKYSGIAAMPAFVVYAFLRRRWSGGWMWAFAVPAAALAGYLSFSVVSYGHAGFGEAVTQSRTAKTIAANAFIGLAFIGGCIAPLMFVAPLLWSRWAIAAGAVVAFAATLGLRVAGSGPSVSTWAIPVHFGVFVAAGVGLGALCVLDYRRRKDAASLMLVVWAAAVYIFSSFVSWSVSGRYILPLVPAAAILAARAIDARYDKRPVAPRSLAVALALAAVVGLAVSWADYTHARSAREAAHRLSIQFAGHPGGTFFQGHWGFQYYMQELGFAPLNMVSPSVSPGDIIVMPVNGSNTAPVPRRVSTELPALDFPTASWVTNMHIVSGVGFHTSAWGPVPFAFVRAPDEQYRIYRIK